MTKVCSALKRMGFQEARARHAANEVARIHGSLTIEQALREALLVATADAA
jgi:Holliday junction resolvasome RuvABC DNA-binding subunit